MRRGPACTAVLAVLLTLTALLHAATLNPGTALPSRTAEAAASTAAVFARYRDRIVKIQVIDTKSNARGSIGTGFFVSADGLLVTNYHVIADRLHEPDDHRVEIVLADGTTRVVNVLGFDVVHDLAILGSGLQPRGFFALRPASLEQGQRLYSLGHPSDLGASIVEGTYNGNLPNTVLPKINFTGSINPGMSGGPAITAAGLVVGVNVSSMGEQQSFLVPEQPATALLARVRGQGMRPVVQPLREVTAQLHDYQQRVLRSFLEVPPARVAFGPFRVPSEPAPEFRCWGDSSASDDSGATPLYRQIWHSCALDDWIYVADDHYVGAVSLEHAALTTERLSAMRFAALYSTVFGEDNTPDGSERHVTPWRCSTRNLTVGGAPVRTVLCLRGLRRLPGLYDGVLKVALLGRPDAGLISTLTLSGVSFENIDRVAARYLEHVAWH